MVAMSRAADSVFSTACDLYRRAMDALGEQIAGDKFRGYRGAKGKERIYATWTRQKRKANSAIGFFFSFQIWFRHSTRRRAPGFDCRGLK